ncbi:cbb3-type cytochrome oxidase assembly protein CcoS [Xanthobacter sp. AM11]|uniref:cbb3-type cytochrome oxidase assembly protein CcoS n=1 Tax=Xanthobacter sp. AM11 TaxID=3380643 RepID=UPI0039BFD235
MNVLVYLLPLALLLGLSGLLAFLWSLRSGQYDDLDGAAVRVLSDDDLPGGSDGSGRAEPAGHPGRRPVAPDQGRRQP